MTLESDLRDYVAKTHRDAWTTRDGTKVPSTDDLPLSNEAVKIKGAVLYADLAESTALVAEHKAFFAAEIYKNYLYAAARVVRARGGTITAYDGDRVMAVFIGDSRFDAAAKAGLQINWVVQEILRPAIKKQYPKSPYILHQKVGISASELFVARTGIRGSNDLVWVGNAANNAAKMAAFPTSYSTYIGKSIYSNLSDNCKFGGNPKRNMWKKVDNKLGFDIYGSTFRWSLG